MTVISPHIVERWTGRALKLGVWVSSGLMALGLLLSAFSPPPTPAIQPSLEQIVLQALTNPWHPTTLMFAGLVCLMLTPFLRVLTAFIGFAAERDRRFVGVSLLVFMMLIGELVYAWMKG